GFFHDVSWHPDGTRVAAASSDGHIWIWDATRGYERDTTSRAMPFIDRKVASGTVRGEDAHWCLEAYVRAGEPVDVKERAPLRKQPIARLRPELIVFGKPLKSGAPQAGSIVAQTLRRWQADPVLAVLRDAEALASCRRKNRKRSSSYGPTPRNC